MTKALVLTPQGEVTQLNLPQESLDTLQEAVGGYIEMVRVTPLYGFYANEEGLLTPGLEANPVASAFYRKIGGVTPIMGTVVFVGKTDAEGYDTDVPDHLEELLKGLVTLNA